MERERGGGLLERGERDRETETDRQTERGGGGRNYKTRTYVVGKLGGIQ